MSCFNDFISSSHTGHVIPRQTHRPAPHAACRSSRSSRGRIQIACIHGKWKQTGMPGRPYMISNSSSCFLDGQIIGVFVLESGLIPVSLFSKDWKAKWRTEEQTCVLLPGFIVCMQTSGIGLVSYALDIILSPYYIYPSIASWIPAPSPSITQGRYLIEQHLYLLFYHPVILHDYQRVILSVFTLLTDSQLIVLEYISSILSMFLCFWTRIQLLSIKTIPVSPSSVANTAFKDSFFEVFRFQFILK